MTRWSAGPCTAVVGIALACSTGPIAGQVVESCTEAPGLERLDFWVGEWTVWVGEELVGRNRIVKVQGGCAIEEHWIDAGGGTGQSLFYFVRSADEWRQVWVTPSALSAGGMKEKQQIDAPASAIRFQGTIESVGRAPYLDRTTLTPLSGGRVRQHIEISTDGGATWRTTFDAEYRPA